MTYGHLLHFNLKRGAGKTGLRLETWCEVKVRNIGTRNELEIDIGYMLQEDVATGTDDKQLGTRIMCAEKGGIRLSSS